jgi:hypothetical protein
MKLRQLPARLSGCPAGCDFSCRESAFFRIIGADDRGQSGLSIVGSNEGIHRNLSARGQASNSTASIE